MTRNDAPGIINPQPSNPFFAAPLLLLDADGIPGGALGAVVVVVGGGVPAIVPDELLLVPVPAVGPLNEVLPAGVAVADTPPLLVPDLSNFIVPAESLHAPT